MQNQGVTNSLRQALASLPRVVTTQAKDDLRVRVHEFVDLSKDEGWPVERVIVALKQVAGEAGVRSSTDVLRRNTNLEQRDALLLDMVRWCVERYFGYKRGAPSEPKVTSPARGTTSQRPERRKER